MGFSPGFYEASRESWKGSPSSSPPPGAYRALAAQTTLPTAPRVLQQHRSFWPAAVLGQHLRRVDYGQWMASFVQAQ